MPTKEKPAPEVVALKSVKGRKEERVTLFSIDDKSFTIPTSIRPNKALRIMHVFREKGETAGVSYMLETLLGAEGYEALLNFDDLEEDDLEKVIKIAFEMVAGSTEVPKA